MERWLSWSKAIDLKSIVLERVPGVRISLSPQIDCTLQTKHDTIDTHSGVAQWQSWRLLTARSLVRPQPPEPWPYHLVVRILPFQGIYTGSSPVRVTKFETVQS